MKIEIIKEGNKVVSAKEYYISEDGWQRERELESHELGLLGVSLINHAWAGGQIEK